jgi:hypothetical protein
MPSYCLKALRIKDNTNLVLQINLHARSKRRSRSLIRAASNRVSSEALLIRIECKMQGAMLRELSHRYTRVVFNGDEKYRARVCKIYAPRAARRNVRPSSGV